MINNIAYTIFDNPCQACWNFMFSKVISSCNRGVYSVVLVNSIDSTFSHLLEGTDFIIETSLNDPEQI